MKRLVLGLLLCTGAWAAIDGTVVNGSTGKPQAGASVTLLRLGQGMERVGTTTADAQGRFHFDTGAAPGGPQLLQATHQDVNYNKMLPPGSPTSGVELQVFDSSPKPAEAKVVQHMILIEPGAESTTVNESIIFENNGKTTYNDIKNGTYQFIVPEGATDLRINAVAPQGMPLNRPAEAAGAPNQYAIRFAVKPGGETRFDLAYQLPANVRKFTGRILHSGGAVRFVAPRGVTLKGENITLMGNEPRTQASIYDLKGASYDLAFEGQGALRGAQPDEDNTPEIESVLPKIYQSQYLVLALAAGILAIGFTLLYRAQTAAPGKVKRGA